MTTTVKVIAHCSDDKQVRIKVSGDSFSEPDQVIQNGEETEAYAYDDRVISVKEEEK